MDNDKGTAAEIKWRCDSWYTGPNPYKDMEVDMEVVITYGSVKGFQERIQFSKVDLRGEWSVLVEQTTSVMHVQPSWMKISEVVEF